MQMKIVSPSQLQNLHLPVCLIFVHVLTTSGNNSTQVFFANILSAYIRLASDLSSHRIRDNPGFGLNS